MAKRGIRTIAVASGKGGAGKTSVALSLGWLLAESGQRVCLVDVDMGLANVDVLMGITPTHTLDELFTTDLAPQAALCPVRPGLDVISGGSGTAVLADLTREQLRRFLKKIHTLTNYDILLLDNSPGIHRQVVSFCLAAREQILVINPEPSSLVDGYALLKVLRQNGLQRPPYLLLNRVAPGFKAKVLMERFGGVCRKHLQLAVLALGVVPDDPRFRDAAARQMLPMLLSASTPARDALAKAARLLARRTDLNVLYSAPEVFWKTSLVSMLQGLSLDETGYEADPVLRLSAGKNEKTAQRPLEAILQDLERGVRELERYAPLPPESAKDLGKQVHGIGTRLLAVAASPSGQPSAGASQGVVGIICPDQSLRRLLQDVLQDRGYRPVVVNGTRNVGPQPEVLLCSATRADGAAAQIAPELAGIPLVWLSQYAQSPPAWVAAASCCEVLQKPFTLEEIDAALRRARSCRSSSFIGAVPSAWADMEDAKFPEGQRPKNAGCAAPASR